MDDDLKHVRPKRLVGRLASHMDDIADARLRTLSWIEIATVLGPRLDLDLTDIQRAALRLRKAYSRARIGIKDGRIKATPIAVPVTQVPATSVARPGSIDPQAPPESKGFKQRKNFKNIDLD